MSLLASGGNGAKLYATFENGLAYEVYTLQLDLCFKNNIIFSLLLVEL